MTPEAKRLLRALPSVASLLEHEEVQDWLHGLPRATVAAALRTALQGKRESIQSGETMQPIDARDILAAAEADLVRRSTPSLRHVINATGIVLHTGLGRAPLCDAAVEAIVEGASGYCNLEYDVRTGSRGKRGEHVQELLSTMTGAETAIVVNNNAAATLLILQTFASGREVIVSRGQLVEIGGSFRLPEIMAAAGVTLKEVGTTNRTRISDYEKAAFPPAAMLVRVHPSNYRITGFTESVSIEEMVELGRKRKLIVLDDLGSGCLVDLSRFGLPKEPTIADSIRAGADIVCCSGDKLLGGPQCGLILGRRDLLQYVESNPLMRTYRVDKLTLLALEATLQRYAEAEESLPDVPVLQMLAASTHRLADRARDLAEQLKAAVPEEQFHVCSDVGFAGGGSLPGQEIESVLVQWRPSRVSAESAAAKLREGDPPVVVRIHEDAVCIDLRTIRESDVEALVAAVSAAMWELESEERPPGISLPIL